MKWWYSHTVWTNVGARFQIFTHSKSDISYTSWKISARTAAETHHNDDNDEEANLIQQNYMMQEAAAQNIKNQHWEQEDRRTQEQTNAWTILQGPWKTINR